MSALADRFLTPGGCFGFNKRSKPTSSKDRYCNIAADDSPDPSTPSLTEQEGARLIGSVEGAGGPAWYGQLHETGGTFNVKEHLRRTGFNRKGEVVKLLNHSGSVRASVASTQAGLVKAHTVTFPARPFMSSALEEMSSEMVADLEQTVGISVK